MFEHWLGTAQLFGYGALVLGVAFFENNDARFKLYMSSEGVAYVAFFILLGNPAAGEGRRAFKE